MTGDELLCLIADAQHVLPNSGIRLLLELAALCIRGRTCEITFSQRDFALRLGLSRDNVRLAVRELQHHFRIDTSTSNTTTFTLPVEWFSSQLGLFSVGRGLETRPLLPGNQASTMPGNQATSGLETRPWWPKNQATLAEKPGHTGLETRPSGLNSRPLGLETRPQVTQNEQLTEDPGDLIRSDQRFYSRGDSVSLINQIMAHTRLKPEQNDEASLLRDHLKAFMRAHGERAVPPAGPHESMLARCLALASLKDILEKLAALAKKPPGRPREWIWFLIIFGQDFHEIPAEVTVDAVKRFQHKKSPAREQMAFSNDLVKQTAVGVRKL